MVGEVGVGGDNPIRLQSMTTTPTTDVDATVGESIRMIEEGCEIVRITAPTMADARALGEIRKKLNAKGFSKIPLVADIHFNPECALEAANHVEKVRVNPGNYADFKAFKTLEYSDEEYAAELSRLEERFTPLVIKCKSLGRSMRLGCNHGSLSDRIMNRYGDTPLGMVEAALEFVRICQKNNYFDIILSMKASNPKVMIEAYRLLVARMDEENMDYPLHLGVTEAGYGEDGRIKSAIGIGSLLNDGLGDTIRVSLTEDPEFEIPVARQIAAPYQVASPGLSAPSPLGRGTGEARGEARFSYVADFYSYSRRPTRELQVGPFKLGGDNPVRVFNDFSAWLGQAKTGEDAARMILELLEAELKSGKDTVPEIIEWTITSRRDLEYLQKCRHALGAETSRLALLGRFGDLTLAKEGLPSVHLAQFAAPRTLSDPQRLDQFRQFVKAAKLAKVPLLLESGPCHKGRLSPAQNVLRGIAICEAEGHRDLLWSLNLASVQDVIANVRLAVALLRDRDLKPTPPLHAGTAPKEYPIHLRYPGMEFFEDERIEASVAFGSLLCDGIGDSVQTGQGVAPKKDLELLYNILQGAGVRITKTEFVSCPSCGRTLFDLQTTTERIKQKTGHLKGVKIAIMGCIVNGPGEMADADFGYVGGAPGKINLYVGKDCVEKGIPFEESDERLIDLIKFHGKWMDPK